MSGTAMADASSDPAQQRGDAARDRRDWAQAIIHYNRHLARTPDDAPIWIQLGHALKESGLLQEADAAYRRALALTPDDADLHLQVGHLMKRMEKLDQAVRSYTRSLSLAPAMSAFHELVALGREGVARKLLATEARPGRAPRTYLQITDFFNYLKAHKTVSGIQRVQLGVIAHFLSMPPGVRDDYRIVYNDSSVGCLWSIKPDRLSRVADYVSSADVDHDMLKSLIDTALGDAEAVHLRPGDTCVITGSFWGLGGSPELLRDCNRNGVYAGVFFHDLLPVTHPEFFDERLADDFQQSLYLTLALTDFGLSNSQYTANEVQRFIARNGLRDIPVSPVPLAHMIKDSMSDDVDEPGDAPWPAAIASLRRRPFVLCVCTIEVRKNHRFLFDAWKALIAEGEDVPDLVLVGRQGWRVDDLMAQLAATRYLNGRIRIVYNLSDEELATLYRHCLFTVFPSIVEGWGLPIGESLSYGKMCVAANTSSMPEVGGDFVEYIDPLNVRDGIEVLRRLIQNPDAILAGEAKIKAGFRPRNWGEVGGDLIAKIDHIRSELGPKLLRSVTPVLEAGRMFSLANNTFDHEDKAQQTLRLALTGPWYAREDIGIWVEGSLAGLEFDTGLESGVPVVVFLCLNVVPWAHDNSLTVKGPDGSLVTCALAAGQRTVIRVKTRTADAGRIALSLAVGGDVRRTDTDTRVMCIGLRSFGYAAQSDAMSRLCLLDQSLNGL